MMEYNIKEVTYQLYIYRDACCVRLERGDKGNLVNNKMMLSSCYHSSNLPSPSTAEWVSKDKILTQV